MTLVQANQEWGTGFRHNALFLDCFTLSDGIDVSSPKFQQPATNLRHVYHKRAKTLWGHEHTHSSSPSQVTFWSFLGPSLTHKSTSGPLPFLEPGPAVLTNHRRHNNTADQIKGGCADLRKQSLLWQQKKCLLQDITTRISTRITHCTTKQWK